MNRKNRYLFVVVCLFLLAGVLISGCTPEVVAEKEIEAPALESAETAADSAARAVAGPGSVDPADRKFYSGGWAGRFPSVTDPGSLAGIHPADRKFYLGGTLASSESAALSASMTAIHPADRKFYNAGWAAGQYASAIAKMLDGIDPADRKFYLNGSAAVFNLESSTPEEIHPADRKFFAWEQEAE